MSLLACNFCAHGNPEGSKFCNECGSPLHLAPCSQCQAINSASDQQCFRCGAPLSAATKEAMLAAAEASAESSPTTTDSVPTAFADRLDALPWDLRASPSEPRASVEDRPSPAVPPAAADPAADEDDRAVDLIYGRGATNSGLGPRLFLGVVVLAVAGVAYWMWVKPTQSPDPQPIDAASTAAPGPTVGAPTVPPQTAATPTGARESPPGDSLATAGPVTSPAESSTSPPTLPDSTSPRVEPSPPVTKQTPHRVGARLPPRPKPSQSSVGKTAKTTTPPPASDAGSSAVTQARTAEQAERDALATQRLIERELGTSPRADSTNDQPSSGQ